MYCTVQGVGCEVSGVGVRGETTGSVAPSRVGPHRVEGGDFGVTRSGVRRSGVRRFGVGGSGESNGDHVLLQLLQPLPPLCPPLSGPSPLPPSFSSSLLSVQVLEGP